MAPTTTEAVNDPNYHWSTLLNLIKLKKFPSITKEYFHETKDITVKLASSCAVEALLPKLKQKGALGKNWSMDVDADLLRDILFKVTKVRNFDPLAGYW